MESVIENLFFLANAIIMVGCVIIGFKMGRATRDEDVRITGTNNTKESRASLDTMDVFSEHINDGLEGDPDERLRTV